MDSILCKFVLVGLVKSLHLSNRYIFSQNAVDINPLTSSPEDDVIYLIWFNNGLLRTRRFGSKTSHSTDKDECHIHLASFFFSSLIFLYFRLKVAQKALCLLC